MRIQGIEAENFKLFTTNFNIIKDIENKIKFKKIYLVYLVIIGVTFIYFYPVVSGMTVSEEYIKATQWLESWYY